MDIDKKLAPAVACVVSRLLRRVGVLGGSLYLTAKTIYVIRKSLTKYSKKLSTQVKRTSLTA